jgi:hypothetical protein
VDAKASPQALEKAAPVDVGAVGEQIVERGDTALHKKNESAAQGGALSFGGGTLDESSPLMVRFSGNTAAERGTRLKSRARMVLTAAELNTAAKDVIQPLAELLGGGPPDPKRFNAQTWSAFQLAATLTTPAREALATALEKGGALPGDLPPTVARAIHTAGVDKRTLGQLVRARDLVTQLVNAELPSLPLEERSAFFRTVHDEGYAKAQLARIASPTTLLCRTETDAPGGALLDDARTALLKPEVRARFSAEARAKHAGTDASFPRLTLADLVLSGEKDALAFLQRSGKDTSAAWPELGGQTPAAFLKQRPGESDAQYTGRLASKQVLNPFARSWDAMLADAKVLGAAGGSESAQLAFLHKKQEAAVAPTLLLVAAPALYQQASPQALDALMQVCFRVAHPEKSFADPLVSKGVQELHATLGEQLAKDRALAHAVVHVETTRVLAGLRDDTYDSRLNTLLTDRGIPVATNAVGQALSRLVRDVGADNPKLMAAFGSIDMKGPEADVIVKLHALRHDPAMFTLALPTASAQLGKMQVKFMGAPGDVKPELVSATTVGYRVTLQKPAGAFSAGESVVLRVPKGARLEVGADGQLAFSVHSAERLSDTSARLHDFEVIDQRVSLTMRSAVHVDNIALLLEKRAAKGSAAEKIASGVKLERAHVDVLADQYVRGLLDVDPTRPRGVFYELGPDNYLLDAKAKAGAGALQGSYVDVAMQFRTERERAAFGFFQGGYASAANWILGDNTPLSASEVQKLWRSDALAPAQKQMREAFAAALLARLDPSHAVYADAPAEVRDGVIADLRLDAKMLGLPSAA